MKVSIVSAFTKEEGIVKDFVKRIEETIPHSKHEVEFILHDNTAYEPYAISFNKALKKATGDYIIQISNDIFPEDDEWIDELVGCSQPGITTTLIRDDHRIYLNHKQYDEDIANYTGISLPSHCWIIKREDLLYYDESLTGFHGEDDDYCLQMKTNGKGLWIARTIIVEHRHKHKDTSHDKELLTKIAYNKKLLKKKWPGVFK